MKKLFGTAGAVATAAVALAVGVAPSASAAGTETVTARCSAQLPITHPGCGRAYVGAPLPDGAPDEHLSGPDRWSTAVAVAEHGFPRADVVVLVNGENAHLVDALGAAPLARSLAAPLLLTSRDSLPAATSRFLRERAVRAVLVVGGDAAVSPAVESQLRELGVGSVGRVRGSDRYATSRAVAALVPASTHAWVASGETRHLVDALAASGPAARLAEPVVLVPRDGDVSATVSELRARGITSTSVAGGAAAVSDAVLRQLPSPERLASDDRWWTALVVADAAVERGVRSDDNVLVSGEDGHLVDALAGATLGRVTLLIGDSEDAVWAVENWDAVYPSTRRVSVGG
ncbi:cell wall-binding repeat-containing protein [Kineococcus sp. SYSU DK004]|uniref:cell wall-binding repeat-containing protein n=1 Tax=Kineococcus sp. SYSU DK004 TaxID=3383125 RepID=UPI003D7EBD89